MSDAVDEVDEAAAAPVVGFLFDLDGTLLAFETASHAALNAALRGVPLPRGSVGVTRTTTTTTTTTSTDAAAEPVSWRIHASIVGTKEEDWSREVLRAVGVDEASLTPKEFARRWHEEIDAALGEMELMPGALELVRGLRRRFPRARMAIATSSVRGNFAKKMRRHAELLVEMDAVVTGDQVERGKPAPDIFVEAARRIGVDPSRCVVFEDAPAGVRAGQAAGAMVVAVPDPRFAEWNAPKFASADVVVSSLEGFLDKWGGVMEERLLGVGGGSSAAAPTTTSAGTHKRVRASATASGLQD